MRQVDSTHSHRLSLCSTTSSESNDGRSFEGSLSPMGIMLSQGSGDMGIRKQSPIISSLKRTGPNNVLHHSLQRISTSAIGSPVRKVQTPTHSVAGRRNTLPEKMLSKTSSEGMLLNPQDDFTQLNRLDLLC